MMALDNGAAVNASVGPAEESHVVTSEMVSREKSSADQFELLKVLGKGGYGKVRVMDEWMAHVCK